MSCGKTSQSGSISRLLVSVLLLGVFGGCGEKSVTSTSAPAATHEHIPPHGGTPVTLGNEEYHLELVRDSTRGRMQVYVMDGELENFVRVPVESFEIDIKFPGRDETLVFTAVASAATGERVGDTALFEAEADWLKSVATFDAVLKELTVRGRKFERVTFNFPKGNHAAETSTR